MKQCLFGLFLSVVLLILFVSPVWAADADVVFDTLADRAGTVGAGLRKSGYLIAGFGLIMFAVLAIFNKVSWKTFGYIAMSCFVLSIMAAVINYISAGGAQSAPAIKFDDSNGGANIQVKGDARSVKVLK